VGERADDFSIRRPESAGAIGGDRSLQPFDERAEHVNAGHPGERLAVLDVAHEPAADDQIAVGVNQLVDQPSHFARPMLAVAVDLDGDVVIVKVGVAVAGLHRAADAEVERQADHLRVLAGLPGGVVGAPVVDEEDVERREMLMNPANQLPDGRPLVVGRHDDQASRLRVSINCVG